MTTKLKFALLLVGAMALPIGMPAGEVAPPGKPPTVDFQGSPLPAGALVRLGTVSFYHEGGTNVAYSGDGKILASAGNGAIRVWDSATGRELGQFATRGRFTLSPFALSQDGARLASPAASAEGLVLIWDTRSGKELHRLSAHQGEVFALAFSPDGKQLATGDLGGAIRLWNVTTGKQEHLLTKNGGYISALAFSRDGKTLFSGEQLPAAAMTRLWDLATGKERQRFPGQAFVALSADGEVMATASAKRHVLHLVNWRTGETLLTLKNFPGNGPPRDINSACFSADGKIIATACRFDSAIRLWNARSGDLVRTIPLAAYAFSVAFSADGKTLAVGAPWGLDHNQIRLFDPTTGDEQMLSLGLQDAVREVRFLPDGKTVAGISSDKTIRVWQSSTGKALRTLELAKLPRAIAPDGSLVAISGQVELMRPGSILPDREDTLELCDTSTGKVKHQLKHDNRVVRVVWAPDGATVAVGTEKGQLYLWDAATGKLRKRWAAPATWSLVFSADGKTLATGDNDCTVQLWQAVTGTFIRRFGKPLEREKLRRLVIAGTTSIAVSPDGKAVAAAVTYQNTIAVWDTSSGEEICQCLGHPFGHNEGWVYALAFSLDGKTLFSGSQDRTIRLWDAATGKERSRLQGHRGPVHTLALSPDGARLASGSKDCTILMWDLVSLTK